MCGGSWATVCQRGFLRRVDRPHAPRNLRWPTEEELAVKVGRKKSPPPPMRRLDGDPKGFGRRRKRSERNTVTDKKIRFSPLALIPCGKRKKGESLIYYLQKQVILHIGLIYICS